MNRDISISGKHKSYDLEDGNILIALFKNSQKIYQRSFLVRETE